MRNGLVGAMNRRGKPQGAREGHKGQDREAGENDRHDVYPERRDHETLHGRSDHATDHHAKDQERDAVIVVRTERGVPSKSSPRISPDNDPRLQYRGRLPTDRRHHDAASGYIHALHPQILPSVLE